LDVARYVPQVRFIMPPQALGAASVAVDATDAAGAHRAVLLYTGTSGVYQAQLTGTDGAQRVERFAYNVTPEEGNLKKLDGPQLAKALDGIRFEFHQAGDINYNPQQLAGFNLSESLLVLLIVALVAEQVLAYACSYHPSAKGGAH
jgi:hypothetical protein